jgi:O-antigen/teichoic acid export membrane protein
MDLLEQRGEIGSGVFFQYVNSFTGVLAGFIFYIYVIHFYSSELVGVVALLLAIASLLNITFSLGLGYGLQHFISYHLGRRELDAIRRIVIRYSTIGLGLAFLSFVFLYFASPVFATLFFHSLKYLSLVKILSLDLFFMVVSTVLGSILIGLQNFRSQAEWNVVGSIIGYILPVILLFLFNKALFIVIGWAIGSALPSIAYSILIHRKTRSIEKDGSGMKADGVLGYAFPIFLASLIGYGAAYVDRFIVSFLLNLSLLGIYNFALLISSAIAFLVSPFVTILLPKLSEMYGLERKEDMRNYVAKGTELISTIYVPIAMLVAALSSPILLLLSSGEYLPASIPIMIVLVTSSIFVSGNILSVSLQGIRKTKIFLITSTVALLANFVLSILLIPKFQMIGASIGYSSISAVSFVIMYYYARKFGVLKFEGKKIAKIYASAFIMFFVVFIVQRMLLYSPLRLIFYIVLGFAVYSGMIKFMKTFDKNDLEFIMRLIPWWLQRIKVVISVLFL